MEYTGLPKEFTDKMKRLLGSDFMAYEESFKKPAFHGLRINNLKIEEAAFSALWNSSILRQIPWIANGFYYEAGEGGFKPARHPYYFAGLYYLQEPSAMTPADLLPISPGDCVLDLCAAPGGKSTALAAKLLGEGFLLSNDISSSRAKALLKNLELFGVGNCCVTSETPEKLARYFEGFFDKILIDAPCSGEGMFRRDKDMVKAWTEKGPAYYSAIQREIVSDAVRMLKPGGLLLYSTCTFDEEEDEGTIRYILLKHPDLKLVDIRKKEGFAPGIGMTECVRLFPHKIEGEGHFIALLQNTAEYQTDNLVDDETSIPFGLDRDSQKSMADFLNHIDRTFSPSRYYVKNDCVYYLPAPLLTGSRDKLLKVRYLRTGLLLGEFKKGRFEPSQALAMNLKKEEFDDVIDLSCKDDRVVRYLKGETLSLTEQEQTKANGWCLVCVDGFPLGFAKRTGASLKNKYYPGWRWQ